MSYDDENFTFPMTQDIDALSEEWRERQAQEQAEREEAQAGPSDEYFEETCPDPKYFNGFHLHAAPVVIEWELRRAQARLQAAKKRVQWLKDLQAKRATQVLRGEWPRPKA